MNSPIISIMTTDLEKSIQFYTTVLGFSKESRLDLEGVTLQFLQHQSVTVELVALTNGPQFTAGTNIALTFIEESFAPVQDKLIHYGEPAPTPIALPSGVQMMRITDPNGVAISIVLASSISH